MRIAQATIAVPAESVPSAQTAGFFERNQTDHHESKHMPYYSEEQIVVQI